MSEDDVVPEEQAEVAPPPNAPEPAPEPAPETAPAVTSEAAPDAAPATDTSGSRRPLLIVGIAVAVVIVLLAVAVVANRGGSSSKTPTATLEPAGEAGNNPFTDSVAVGKPTVFPKEVGAIITQLRSKLPTSKQTQTLVATGTAPGVYAGNPGSPSCNAGALTAYLEKNPGNAAAWTKALGIQRSNISTFVSSLTPVVLTNDTRFTNNGYDNAAVSPRQSILQAGTAVMVDATGTPRVVCASGNPLTATRPIVITKTKGDAWPGFDPKNVVTIKPGAATQTLSLLNSQTGQYYPQVVGSTATPPPPTGPSAAGLWVRAQPDIVDNKVTSTAILTISRGSTWKETAVIQGEGVAGIAWGDGKWVAVTNANLGGKGNHVLVSTDLKTWKQVAALPNRLSAVAFGNGRWTATALHYEPAVGTSGLTRAQRVIYSSTDATHWTQVAVVGEVTQNPWPPGRGPVRPGPVAYGSGQWLTAVASGASTTAKPIPPMTLYTSKDGLTWKPNGIKFPNQIGTALGFRNGTFSLGSVSVLYRASVFSRSTNGADWIPGSKDLHQGGISAIAAGSGGWTAVVVSVSATGPLATFLTSTDAKTWKPVGSVREYVSALAFGGTSEGGSKSPATTTTHANATNQSATTSTASSVRVPQ